MFIPDDDENITVHEELIAAPDDNYTMEYITSKAKALGKTDIIFCVGENNTGYDQVKKAGYIPHENQFLVFAGPKACSDILMWI